ncbi:hypothetical protein DPMN_144017 [Dreissena polymorpha]|uniref:Transposase n=1 Tax=Dreissena polymorpha TaxID=45954 RepID=A0A9D4JM71_DREPO|nr:hypothetical protein DPMN_144017 [Dreissena polymorpha]
MLGGIIKRYTDAEMPPPTIVYVDRDCYGTTQLRQALTKAGWKTHIWLDVWHFMRRISTWFTTEYRQFVCHLHGLTVERLVSVGYKKTWML